MTQIFFDEVMCFVDLKTGTIYSAKLKKLKPQHLKRHKGAYYMIKYLGNKSYKSYEWLINKANEKLKSKDNGVL